jgi:protein TonB
MPLLIGGIFFAVLIVGVVMLIRNFLDNPDKPNPRRIQQIPLIKPPEPPPPPPPEEKPPEVKEEVKINEPPPPAEAPPPGANLGLDAEGKGNGDAFGLIGNKNGRELTLGFGDNRFGGYLGGMQNSIRDQLSRNEKLRKGNYKIDVAIWIDANGGVTRFEMLASSGAPDLDAAVKKVLAGIKQFDEPPPDMPQPVKLRISSR